MQNPSKLEIAKRALIKFDAGDEEFICCAISYAFVDLGGCDQNYKCHPSVAPLRAWVNTKIMGHFTATKYLFPNGIPVDREKLHEFRRNLLIKLIAELVANNGELA